MENAIVLPVKDTVPLEQVGLFNCDECSTTSLILEVLHDLIDQAATESDLKNGLSAVQGELVVNTVGQEMATNSHQQSKVMERGKFEVNWKRKASSFVEKTTNPPKKIAIDIKIENREMVTHSHQVSLIQLEHPRKAAKIHSQQKEEYIASWTSVNERSAKMFEQLNGTVFVSLENCTNVVGIKEEPLDEETAADPVHGINGWMCTSCNYVSPKKYNVSQHIQYKHSLKRAFTCVSCSKPFKTNRDLNRHETRCQGQGQPMPGRPVGSIQSSRTE